MDGDGVIPMEIIPNITIPKSIMKVSANKNKKSVSFSEDVEVYEYEKIIPCLQEYLYGWEECKKEHLQNQYLLRYRTLNGFDLAKALKENKAEEEYIEAKECLEKEVFMFLRRSHAI